MTIEYQYNSETNILKCVVSGALHLDEILAYFDEVSNSNIQAGCVEYLDLTNLSVAYINYQDNNKITRAYSKLILNGCIGSVIYAPNKLGQSIFANLTTVFAKAGFRLLVVHKRQAVKAAIESLRNA